MINSLISNIFDMSNLIGFIAYIVSGYYKK